MDERCGAPDDFYPPKETCIKINGHDGGHGGEFNDWSQHDADPNELGTFTEYLNAYTARGGMTDDERTAYWMGWVRIMLIWTFVLAGAGVVMLSYRGLVADAGRLGAIYAGLVLAWQGVEAVRFAWWSRR